jgi:CO/xanthine dehydrogenase Mo-binding subunit
MTALATSRAGFLAAGGALIVSFGLPPATDAQNAGGSGPFPPRDPAQLDTWIAVGQDGNVTFYTGRIDFGQHKSTAFAQIVADELDVAYENVKAVMGDTALTPNQGASSASDGLLNGAKPVRHAAAEARRVLVERAAAKFGVDPSALSVVNGVVFVTADPSKRARYGELVGTQKFNVTLKVTNPDTVVVDAVGTAKLKDPKNYTVVGKSLVARDIPAKVTGAAARVHNVKLPDMLHARLLLPPYPGARVARVGGFKKPISGVRVIHRGDFVAVVSKNEWTAIQAAQQLDIAWTSPDLLPGSDEVYSYLRTAPQIAPPKTVRKVGDTGAALATAARVFEAEYRFPSQNHGMIGPSCGVADVRPDRVTLYAGTQDPPGTRADAAKMLGVPLDTVRVIPVEPSGCYGRLGIDDATVAAALISKEVGKPVRVQLMRDQEHAWEPGAPPSVFAFKAGVDATGKIIALEQSEWTWGLVEAELPVMLTTDNSELKATFPAFFRIAGGGETGNYQFANHTATGYTVAPRLRGTAMRSPGRIQINFSGEQFLDEIAAATKQDPIEFRLRHTSDPRSIAVLQAAAKAAGWETRPSPGPDATSNARIARGRGVSFVASQRSTWVATIADVEVDRQTGNVTVKRINVAVDPGIVVNPVAIEAQIEGATIYATSRALKEEVRYTKSKIATTDWVSYPILRFTEIPDINITLLNRPDQPPGGIGEPPNTTPAAAIANAIFDATGVRLRELPFTPARVKAALA